MQYTFSILIMDLWNRKKHTQNTWINLLDSSEGQDSALARPGQVQSENMWLESLQINKCAQTWASTNLARRSHVNTCPDISIYPICQETQSIKKSLQYKCNAKSISTIRHRLVCILVHSQFGLVSTPENYFVKFLRRFWLSLCWTKPRNSQALSDTGATGSCWAKVWYGWRTYIHLS